MLMDDRGESCVGTENAVKSVSLECETVYKQRPRVSAVKKGGSRVGGRSISSAVKRRFDNDDDRFESATKKSKKDVLLSSLALLGKKDKKSDGKGRLKSKLGKLESVEDLGVGGGDGLDGIVHSLNSGVKIPRRPRDLVGRKKIQIEVDISSEEVSSDKGVLDGGNVIGSAHYISDGSVIVDGKGKQNSRDHKENRSVSPDLLQHMKRDGLCSFLCNGNLVTKKSRRNHRKKKETRVGSSGLIVEAKHSLDESHRICDDSQEDEENLEANAARMLSSRFDPSCMGFPNGGKSSKVPYENGLSALISYNRDLAIQHSNKKDDSGVAWPRVRQKAKGHSRERRRFYAVVSKDLDSFWVLNRRIKVFWPLDHSWYIGHIIGYDQEKNLHHVKYDDREEEWIDLQHERFKLFVFPSELPEKGGRIIQTAQSRKERHGETVELEETNNGSSMDCEPIISWLARSTHRKLPSVGVKKKRTLSSTDSDNPASGSVSTNNLGDSLNKMNPIAEHCLPDKNKAPIVYFRRRFHRRELLCSVLEGESSMMLLDCISHPSTRLSTDEFIWDTDCSGVLKLIKPITKVKVSGFDLSSNLPRVTSNMVGWLSDIFVLQNGTLISMWPMIHLEMLFVDNIFGVWFLLFEGCMKQAVSFVFSILDVFCHSKHTKVHDDQKLLVTSIRFQISGLHYLEKQLVFTFYNFSQLSNSKWSYLDRKLKKHCILNKRLAPSDCTFDNIKALRKGCDQFNLNNFTQKPFSGMNLWKRFGHRETNSSFGPSNCVKLSRLAFDCDMNIGKLPPYPLTYATAPTLFLSLHLRLLMERNFSSSSFDNKDPVYLMDYSENEAIVLSPLSTSDNSPDLADEIITKPSHSSQLFPEKGSVSEVEKVITGISYSEQRLSAALSLDADDHIYIVDNKMKGCHLNGLTVDVHSSVPVLKDTDTYVQNIEHTIDVVVDTGVGVCSPNPTASQSLCCRRRNGSSYSSSSASLSPGWIDRNQDFIHSSFGRGPKKPRTQVSYSLPYGGQDFNSKSKFFHSKSFSHKRIRRASEKKTSEAFGTKQRNIELSCEANVLVTLGDRGWREFGAKIVLELFDNNEWRLAIKISGDTRFSYKAHHFVQPGTTNRYTHAMMWKGSKDWILEFPDRLQWTTFKEIHEECYNRNFRAASVKNIPIPGVRVIEETDDNVPEVPYSRPYPYYHWQDETDIDIAMDPSHVLYDMDSDDERWIMTHRGLDFNESGCGNVSDEMFERTIDVLEKLAYAEQRDNFTLDELEDTTAKIGSLEAIGIIYEYWREKRHKKGMPLVRYLQPPLWEKYQHQVKEWEKAVAKSNASLIGGCQDKASTVEKPPMFAFCLKPRGLEMPDRGAKQRSQKKFPVGALSNEIPVGRRLSGFDLGDDRVVYTVYNQATSDSSPVLQGSTRVFSPRDFGSVGYFSLSSDGNERNHYPKLYRNKSKKLCLASSLNNQPPVASYSQRTPCKRSSVHLLSPSEWQNQLHYQVEGFHWHNFKQLDPAEIDEFKLRDASSAARHAVTIAKTKRENAQRMLCRADLAMHRAVAAIMTAEAVKASYNDLNSDIGLSG